MESRTGTGLIFRGLDRWRELFFFTPYSFNVKIFYTLFFTDIMTLTHVCACTCSSPYSLSHFPRASGPWAPPTDDPKESMRYPLWIFVFHFFSLTLILVKLTFWEPAAFWSPHFCFLNLAHVFRFYTCTCHIHSYCLSLWFSENR